LRKYGALFVTAFQNARAERAVAVGRLLFFIVMLFMFSRLWLVLKRENLLVGFDASGLLWYLTVTEWVLLSLPPLYLHIQGDVRSGDVAARLPQPMSYVGARLAQAAGTACFGFLVLVAGGSTATFLLAGPPPSLFGLFAAALMAALSVAVMLVFSAAIGLCAFFIEDTSPAHWIWQKLAFVGGGLIVPLSMYPDWLRGLAEHTPFAALIYGSARLVFEPARAPFTLVGILAWALVAVALTFALERRALRSLVLNGG
jgi:ABC-2 type transport system permease protein